eukprot:COSAG02_NODE_5802_length_4026_cov_4.072320_2_plen_80_part_00
MRHVGHASCMVCPSMPSLLASIMPGLAWPVGGAEGAVYPPTLPFCSTYRFMFTLRRPSKRCLSHLADNHFKFEGLWLPF